MQSILAGVNPAGAFTFVAAATLVLLIDPAGTSIPALRAVRVDPLPAIRAEQRLPVRLIASQAGRRGRWEVSHVHSPIQVAGCVLRFFQRFCKRASSKQSGKAQAGSDQKYAGGLGGGGYNVGRFEGGDAARQGYGCERRSRVDDDPGASAIPRVSVEERNIQVIIKCLQDGRLKLVPGDGDSIIQDQGIPRISGSCGGANQQWIPNPVAAIDGTPEKFERRLR